MIARTEAGDFDCKLGVKVAEQITNACSCGRIMNDGRTACQVPKKFKYEFAKYAGIEMELTEDDFPVVETEV